MKKRLHKRSFPRAKVVTSQSFLRLQALAPQAKDVIRGLQKKSGILQKF
jgi:hypothetical protein